ncbi:hypothetical protein BpHYR1_048228 [Brachionus plicatilis]|uniref:Uncharacterized protein n=1 Tax=Brachionus plicatilis TaxID=10195 RepID=A0A3M7QFS7_BRAPC|nr:hypothetical protein BpHYR1_048228 [Brachionus plicatilis]
MLSYFFTIYIKTIHRKFICKGLDKKIKTRRLLMTLKFSNNKLEIKNIIFNKSFGNEYNVFLLLKLKSV